jgi:hypothetical protein
MPKDLADDMAKHFADRDAALKLIDDDKDRQETFRALDEFESSAKKRDATPIVSPAL